LYVSQSSFVVSGVPVHWSIVFHRSSVAFAPIDGYCMPAGPTGPPSYALSVSAVPRNEISETGRDGMQGSVRRSDDTGATAANTSAARQPTWCAMPPPCEMPDAYTRFGSTQTSPETFFNTSRTALTSSSISCAACPQHPSTCQLPPTPAG